MSSTCRIDVARCRNMGEAWANGFARHRMEKTMIRSARYLAIGFIALALAACQEGARSRPWELSWALLAAPSSAARSARVKANWSRSPQARFWADFLAARSANPWTMPIAPPWKIPRSDPWKRHRRATLSAGAIPIAAMPVRSRRNPPTKMRPAAIAGNTSKP